VNDAVRVVYLKASSDLLSQRLLGRRGHYMKQSMLASQLATLEEPENALTVNANGTPEQIVCDIRGHFGLV
jgi:gluconokinase